MEVAWFKALLFDFPALREWSRIFHQHSLRVSFSYNEARCHAMTLVS